MNSRTNSDNVDNVSQDNVNEVCSQPDIIDEISEVRSCFYDYNNQAWVTNGVYQRCGHPDSMNCQCYGRIHEGETYTK